MYTIMQNDLFQHHSARVTWTLNPDILHIPRDSLCDTQLRKVFMKKMTKRMSYRCEYLTRMWSLNDASFP